MWAAVTQQVSKRLSGHWEFPETNDPDAELLQSQASPLLPAASPGGSQFFKNTELLLGFGELTWKVSTELRGEL